MRANKLGNRGRKENIDGRDGGTGRIMSWIEKRRREAVLPPYTKCDSVTGSANQYSYVFKIRRVYVCAHRSGESEGQRRGPED